MAVDYNQKEILFQFQFGFEKDFVRYPIHDLNLKSLKDLACHFINQKFPDNNLSRLNDRLLLFRHDYDTVNILQLINSITEISENAIVEITLTGLPLGPEINIVQPHILNVHSYKVPTFCDFCGEMLFGIVRQGLKCDGCGQNFHKRCVIKIPSNCSPNNCNNTNANANTNGVIERHRRRPSSHLQPQIPQRSPSGNSSSSSNSNHSDTKVLHVYDSHETVKPVNKNVTICIPHTFVKHSYTRPTVCQHCKKLLKGLFKQGYQCKDCHYNAHKNCIDLIPKDCTEDPSTGKDTLLSVDHFDSPNSSSNDDTSPQNYLDFDDDDDKAPKLNSTVNESAPDDNKKLDFIDSSCSSTSTPSANIPLMRIVQSVKHTRKQRTHTLKEGWLVHFTSRDLTSRRHFWRLDSKSIILFQNDQDTKYFKELILTDIDKIQGANERVSVKVKHCFELHTSSNVIYYVGQDPLCDLINSTNLELPSADSGIGAYLARSWETSIRQALMPLSKNCNGPTPENTEVNEEEITDINLIFEIMFDEVLGSGQFGIVYGGIHKSTYRPVAIKVIDKLRFPTKQEAQLKNEVAILQNLTYPGVVNLERTFETPEKIFVVMEKLTGDMLEMILSQKNARLDERIAKFLITQILVALRYLHNKNIVHCDLKPENVLLNSNDDFPQVKLCDFGFARIIGEKSFRRSVVGTPAYLAPEVLRNKGYNRSLDMWSVGVIIYVSLSGTFPFNEDEDINDQIQNAAFMYPPNPWDQISNHAIDLINSLLQVKQRKRFTVDKTLQHLWLQDYQTWCDLRALEAKVGCRYLTHESDDEYWESYNSSQF